MRIGVLADIGQPVYHVGDEAMAHAAGHEIAARGHTPVYLTRDTQHTRDRFGAQAEVMRALRFPGGAGPRAQYLRAVRAHLAGAPTGPDTITDQDQLHGFLTEMRTLDALVIAGGGNMNSSYGWLLLERLATLAVADRLGIPSFVTGQTLGPRLDPDEAEMARELLPLALGFAAREGSTFTLARRFIAADRLHLVTDDATFLDRVPWPLAPSGDPGLAGASLASADSSSGAIVVTLTASFLGRDDETVTLLAGALDALARHTGREVHLVPHMARPGTGDGDLGADVRLATAMATPAVLLPMEHALVAARRAQGASLIVTARYHPAVFALPAGVPVLPLARTEYSRVRLQGALENWGLGQRSVFVPEPGAATQRELTESLIDLWEQRDAIGGKLAELRPVREREAAQFWDGVVAAVATGKPAETPVMLSDAPTIVLGDSASRASAADRSGVATSDPTPKPAPAATPTTPPAPAPAPTPTPIPTVSIVVRTKDRPRLLARALADIAAQTYRDLEVIVVNDGGAVDPVAEVVAQSALPDGQIRVLHRETSRGMEAASNAGVQAARGELISIHDDDDTWEPTFLAETTRYLEQHPMEWAVIGRTEIIWEVLPEDGGPAVEEKREPSTPAVRAVTIADVLRYNRVVPISLLYRAAVHQRIGYFDESLPVVGDWDFNLRLLRLGPVWVVGDGPIAHWRRRRATEGADANSMVRRYDHRHYDRMVRDRALRAYLDAHGIGELLHLGGLLPDLTDGLGRRTSREIRQIEARIAAVEQQLGRIEDSVGRLATLLERTVAPED